MVNCKQIFAVPAVTKTISYCIKLQLSLFWFLSLVGGKNPTYPLFFFPSHICIRALSLLSKLHFLSSGEKREELFFFYLWAGNEEKVCSLNWIGSHLDTCHFQVQIRQHAWRINGKEANQCRVAEQESESPCSCFHPTMYRLWDVRPVTYRRCCQCLTHYLLSLYFSPCLPLF